MEEQQFLRPSPPPKPSMDHRSGFCPETKTFHSLRPAIPLPPPFLPLSFPDFALSLLPSPLPSHPALIDAATSASVSFPSFFSRVNSLASALHAHAGLSRSDVAFILSPATLDIPILYFALLSLGVTISPANPAASPSELSRLVRLTNPSIAFAVSSTVSKLPSNLPTLLLDSPTFRSFLEADVIFPSASPAIEQSDVAAIQFSSGTTGHMKAAALTHRNFIAMTAGFQALQAGQAGPDVTLLSAPMFHSLGFFFALKTVALGDTLVMMDRVTFPDMMRAAEKYGVTQMTAAPPVVLAMARSEDVMQHDISALKRIFCGGAPLSEDAAERFSTRFPGISICQAYGSTEAGGISRMIYADECKQQRSVGRLSENLEAKIVDPLTREFLSIGQQGELWIRSPAVMKGYVGDEEANVKTFDCKGWLKTGDLCYIDDNGYIYIVDRLKELIKYKAYQVPPAELEQVLQSSPEIIDAAVVPYPQEEVGQIPMAFVVRQPGSKISAVEVMDYVAKKVAPYKKIRKVSFVNSIPKSAAGKILRKELATYAMSAAPVSRL
ncbi:4-coumarate--CoA ligase-like 7 [Dendrobium catenatum]|uniref:4-coumarate--CoA ligase-like 7 n=1 Tax=Dendrobium catenatum TaxID=906689 RepID=UPI0010A03FF8|nr:4-coumarate--CoA ligase-like 7 [Dendrobium catenatum]